MGLILRSHLTGSDWKYAFMSMGWSILAILTIGLVWPWASASLERFRVNHTWYGNLWFSSDAKWSDIIKPFLVIWVVLIMPIGFLAIIGMSLLGWFNSVALTKIFSGYDSQLAFFNGLVTYATIVPIFGIIIYPWYKAVIMRTYFSKIKAGTASLKASFSTGLFYKVWFKTILVTIAASIVLGILGGIVYYLLSALFSINLVQDQTFLTASGIVAYVIWIAVSYVITITIYHFGIWHYAGNSMVIINPGCIEEVQAGSKKTVGGINEGFADALDVGGGFEIGL